MARNAKQPVEDSGPGEGWLTTYGDLVTLLLVFFVVLYAMANTDLQNFQKIALSLRIAFNGASQYPSSDVIQSEQNESNAQPNQGAAPLFFDNLPPKRRDFVRISSELTTFAQELGVQGEISVNMTMEGIIVSLSEQLTFEPGQSGLQPEVESVLDKVAELLDPIDNKVRIEGHTDSIPTNSPMYPSNWELSVLRSVSVIHYLSNEAGLPPERLQAAGSAEFKPVAPNDTRANRALNRRVDIVILYPGESRQFSVSMPPS
jgi:chemotaxis protein MotB